MSINDHIKIKKYCEKLNIKYLASCFDIDSTKFYKRNLNKSEIKIKRSSLTNDQMFRDKKRIKEKEVDDILEKISQSGFESLTNVEKNKLFEQSKK